VDFIEMRRVHEAVVEGEIRAGRMSDYPPSFYGFQWGLPGVDWFW
jgi:hypothetical protein